MSFLRLPGRADPAPDHATPRGLDTGRRIGIVLHHLVFRVDLRGAERVPTTGGIVFVANHTAFIDGPVLFGLLPRRVSFLVKAEAVTGVLGWVLTRVGQYAIRREAPQRDVLLRARDQLVAGGCIGVFPEGARGSGSVEQVFNGAGWLAVRSGARVVPVAIRGTHRDGARRRYRPRVDVEIGESFAVEPGSGKRAVDAATALIRDRLQQQVAALDARRTGGTTTDRTRT